MLDFSKLTAAVKSVADLAASHASLSALAQDAKAVEDKVRNELTAEFDALKQKAQGELDSITAALEAALGSSTPLTHAEAVGVTAVATALSAPAPAPAPDPAPAPAAPPAPTAPEGAVPPVGGLDVPHPQPQTVEEYNEMRAKGLIP